MVSTIDVRPVASSVGAMPPPVFHVTGNDDQVTVKAVPSLMNSVMDCPEFHAPAVGVLLSVSVHVWIEPFAGDSAGVVPVTANTSSV